MVLEHFSAQQDGIKIQVNKVLVKVRVMVTQTALTPIGQHVLLALGIEEAKMSAMLVLVEITVHLELWLLALLEPIQLEEQLHAQLVIVPCPVTLQVIFTRQLVHQDRYAHLNLQLLQSKPINIQRVVSKILPVILRNAVMDTFAQTQAQ
jgi:dynactin complex subunit